MSDVVVEETSGEEPAAVADAPPDLAQLLSVFPGSPSKERIEGWKQEHGEIFCSGFSETELFIWRPLSRREYVELQKALRQSQGTPQAMSELEYEDAVVTRCSLWSSTPSVLEKKGGSVSTLSEQIMLNSNFVPPAVASAYVIKL